MTITPYQVIQPLLNTGEQNRQKKNQRLTKIIKLC